MLFADDSYLFCKADSSEAGSVIELLRIYEKASGQQVNKAKSSIFYSSNVMNYNREAIGQVLQMSKANDHSTYLGLPNVIGKNKSALLGYLKNRVNDKIRTWERNCISRSGKEILVKHVAQTMPSYAMSVFLLPLEITRNIEKSLSKFWWTSNQSSNSKLNWMRWDRMAMHKHVGGMGFRHFRDFNIAMLGKQLWRSANNPNSLVSKLYKAKYYAKSDVFHAQLGHNPSFIWRNILEAKQLISDGIRWRVGDGSLIQILDQPWLLGDANPYITSSPEPLQGKTVAYLMCIDSKEWDLEVVSDVLNERDQELVLAIPLAASSGDDKLFWNLEESGNYSVKSAYKLLQAQRGSWYEENRDEIWKLLWHIKAPPKALKLVWRAMYVCLPTLVQLQIKRVSVNSICPVCQLKEESILHSLVSCQYAQQSWLLLLPGINFSEASCFNSWLLTVFSTVDSRKHAEIDMLCWSLWRSRNDLIWNQKTTSALKTVAAARQYLAQWKATQNRLFVTPLQPLLEGDGACTWVKPQPNKVKVSVDAAVF